VYMVKVGALATPLAAFEGDKASAHIGFRVVSVEWKEE
jgi:hypothetical protein